MYNYTKPRGPIAAMFNSPGPAYALPGIMGHANPHDPRNIHLKAPAYSFGLKHGKWSDDCSPGPCHMPGYGIYRDGKLLPPAYTLADRPKTAPHFTSQGPAAYAREKNETQNAYRAPSYTFGWRNKHRLSDKTPAPNAYTLDPMLSKTIRSGKKQAPIYSMVFRKHLGGFHEDLAKTPGPGAYGAMTPDIWKNKNPQYTMVFKHNMLGDSTTKPGPGAHSPENSNPSRLKRGPTFHMGIRHSPYTSPLITADC